ncbi:GNS1/SUR4 family-domain-containing protein [Lipomyces japonicus]|uniref:GNS1/SUR4 family-domain-containing protein n=1 Tax=Lipomyces japonicus TaxID=56871 RepID=UPI0034CD54A5
MPCPYTCPVPEYLRPHAPTVDRPFGFYLWDAFTEASKFLFKWDPSKFEFVQGTLPWSTLTPVIVTIASYYVVILGGRKIMTGFQPFKFTFLFRVHNLLLTFISGLLLLLFIEQLFPILYRHGLFYAICNEGAWTQPIVTLYYLNYLTKYFELLDTVFLVVKKKPLTFLHSFHHGATAALCYSQIVGHTSVSWVVITLNLFVHVIMYFYYFLSSCGIRVWWKEWVTRTQIIQFIIDIGFIYFASYTYFASTYFPHYPNAGKCAGEEFAAVYGCLLITSYLFLFIGFYINVYHKKGKKARADAKKASALKQNTSVKADGKVSTTAKEDSPVKVAKKPSKKV